jgi:Holliday junction resolvasome RuvABC endonuclease subunit
MPLIVSIDPGLVNFGWAVVDSNTLELVECGVNRVRRASDGDAQTAVKIVELSQELVQKHSPAAMLIENQGQSLVLKGIQQCAVTAFLMLGVPVHVLYAQTIKAHFRGRGLGFRGNKQNKIDAAELVVRLGYPEVVHHVADCLLMVVYAVESRDAQI